MNPRRQRVCAGCTLLRLLPSLLALPLASGRELSLAQALAQAEAQDLEALRLELDLETLGVALKHPESWEHPELRLGNVFEEGEDDQFRIALRLRPPPLLRKSAQTRTTRASMETARAGLESIRAKRTAEVSRLYYRALYQSQKADSGRREVVLHRAYQAALLPQLEQGHVLLVDTLRVQADLAEARVRLAEMERDRQRAEVELFERVGLVWTPGVVFSTPFEDPEPPTVAAFAANAHPALQHQARQQKEVEAKIERERSDSRPAVSFLQASYELENGRDDNDQWGLALGLTLPLFDRKPADLAELRAEQSHLNAAAGALRRSIETLRNVTLANLTAAWELLGDLESQLSGLNEVLGDPATQASMTLADEHRMRLAHIEMERAAWRARLDLQLALVDYRYVLATAD